MKLTNTENKIRHLLSGEKSEVNGNDIWNKIENRVPKKKPNFRRGIIWLSVFSLSLLGVISFLLIKLNNSTDYIATTAVSELLIQKNKNTESIPANDVRNSKNTKESTTKVNKSTSNTSESKNTSPQLEPNFLNNSYTSLNVPKNKSPFNSTIDQRQNFDNKIEKNTNKTLTTVKNNQSNKSQQLEITSLSFPTIPSIISHNFLNHTRSISLKNFQIEVHKKAKFYPLKITVGIGSVMALNKSKLINSNSEFDSSLFHSESNLPGLSSSFHVSKSISPRSSIYTGISIAQSVSRITDNRSLLHSNVSNDTISIYINENLEETVNLGSVQNYSVLNNDINWHRRHLQLDLEAGMGLEVFNFKRLNLQSLIGFQLALLQGHTGYYFYENSNQIQKFVSSDSNPYNRSIDYGFHLGLHLNMTFRQFDFGLKPTLRINKNQLLNNDSFYNISKTQLGLQFTTTYRLSWVD